MSVARFNFSHGTHEWHARAVAAVRGEARRQGRHVAVLQDLQGPKIRLGRFKGGAAVLQRGAVFTLATGNVTGDATIGGVDHAGLPADVRPRDLILLNDGAVRLAVQSVSGRRVRCRVLQGGTAGDRQGVNLPGREVSLPSLTRKDRNDLAFGLGLGVDYVALSFVRSAEDVRGLELFEALDALVGVLLHVLLDAFQHFLRGHGNVLDGLAELHDDKSLAFQ